MPIVRILLLVRSIPLAECFAALDAGEPRRVEAHPLPLEHLPMSAGRVWTLRLEPSAGLSSHICRIPFSKELLDGEERKISLRSKKPSFAQRQARWDARSAGGAQTRRNLVHDHGGQDGWKAPPLNWRVQLRKPPG